MKIVVDFDKCTGLGLCESIAPEYFEIDPSGALAVLRQDVDPADLAAIDEAVAGCPTEALRIERS